MSGNLLRNPRPQFFDSSGNPLNAGTLSFFESGTSTALDTYSDPALTTANANPLTLDSAGRPSTDIFLKQQSYKVVLKDSLASTIWTVDPVSNVLQLSLTGTATVDTVAALTALAKATLADGVIYEVYGRLTKADGYGGKFKWSASDTTTADGGVTFAANEGGTGRWRRIFSGPPHVGWFGAVGDNATDDTAAIQSAINYTATNSLRVVEFDARVYKFLRLYLHYDDTDNPGYPVDAEHRGRITLQGAGKGSLSNLLYADFVGTVLNSTDVLGPAIFVDGDPADDDTHRTDLVSFRDLDILAHNSTWVVDLYRVTQSRKLFDSVNIRQNGIGGGVRLRSGWLLGFNDLRIEGSGAGTSSTGLWIYNPASDGSKSNLLSGGFYDLNGVRVNAFISPIILGGRLFGDGKRCHSFSLNNVQGGEGAVGITLGHGVDQVWGNVHVESNAIGMEIAHGADNVFLIAGSCVNCDRGIWIGSAAAAENRARKIRLSSWLFTADSASTEFVHVYSGSDVEDVILEDVQMTQAAGATVDGIVCDPGAHNNLQIIRPRFSGSFANEIVNSKLAQVVELDGQLSMQSLLSFKTGSNIISASTISIPTDGNIFYLIGSTAVTSINAPSYGEPLIILKIPLGGSASLIDGPGMILSGNWTPNSNDTIMLFYSSIESNWVELSRSSN